MKRCFAKKFLKIALKWSKPYFSILVQKCFYGKDFIIPKFGPTYLIFKNLPKAKMVKIAQSGHSYYVGITLCPKFVSPKLFLNSVAAMFICLFVHLFICLLQDKKQKCKLPRGRRGNFDESTNVDPRQCDQVWRNFTIWEKMGPYLSA
jgi:hypothetical protein